MHAVTATLVRRIQQLLDQGYNFTDIAAELEIGTRVLHSLIGKYRLVLITQHSVEEENKAACRRRRIKTIPKQHRGTATTRVTTRAQAVPVHFT